ncbi:MAG: hypothetical protein JSW00_03440 [Thermoplasmata archaeon]|nr:MAG: hypothetical protein JSW00_03440 [Thermoplasmata archaeon]
MLALILLFILSIIPPGNFWIGSARAQQTQIRPYRDTSPWNTLLGPNPPIDPNSSALIAEFGAETLSSDPTQYTYPVYEVNSSTPLKTVYIGGWFSHVVNDDTLWNQGGGSIQVPIPDGAEESAGTDAQIVMWNPETGDEWGFYHASENVNGTWNVTNGYHYNTTFYGVPPDGFASRGAGVPYLAGLIRPWEIDRAHIDHAIAFAYDYPADTYVFPATKSDGLGTFPPDLPEGARLQLDPTLDDTDFDAWGLDEVGKIIAHALQDYGMIVIDNAGRPKIYAEYEGTAGWGGILQSNTVDPIPLSAFRVLALDGPYPGAPPKTEEVTLVSSGEEWLYNETYPQPPSTPEWFEEGFDDSDWLLGWTAFGFGDNESYGTVLNDNNGSYYFRKTFSIDPGLEVISARVKVASDNCARVYLNGVIIDDDLGNDHEFDYWNRVVDVSSGAFQIGANTLAVYVYNTAGSSDAYMDLELEAMFAANFTYLSCGWNLVSIPFIQEDQDLITVLEDIDGYYDAVQWYDPTDSADPWKHYKVGKLSGNDLFYINEKMGFWVHIIQLGETIFVYNGSEPKENQTITLYPGWNMVGYPSLSNYNRTEGLNNLTFGMHVDAIWAYNGKTQKWKKLGESDYFEIGKGYYIHSKEECIWEVPL